MQKKPRTLSPRKPGQLVRNPADWRVGITTSWPTAHDEIGVLFAGTYRPVRLPRKSLWRVSDKAVA